MGVAAGGGGGGRSSVSVCLGASVLGALACLGASTGSGSATAVSWLRRKFPIRGFNRRGAGASSGVDLGGFARKAREVEKAREVTMLRYGDGAANLDSIAPPSLDVEALKTISKNINH